MTSVADILHRIVTELTGREAGGLHDEIDQIDAFAPAPEQTQGKDAKPAPVAEAPPDSAPQGEPPAAEPPADPAPAHED